MADRKVPVILQTVKKKGKKQISKTEELYYIPRRLRQEVNGLNRNDGQDTTEYTLWNKKKLSLKTTYNN
jgi:hypothetical protein